MREHPENSGRGRTRRLTTSNKYLIVNEDLEETSEIGTAVLRELTRMNLRLREADVSSLAVNYFAPKLLYFLTNWPREVNGDLKVFGRHLAFRAPNEWNGISVYSPFFGEYGEKRGVYSNYIGRKDQLFEVDFQVLSKVLLTSLSLQENWRFVIVYSDNLVY